MDELGFEPDQCRPGSALQLPIHGGPGVSQVRICEK